MNIQFPHSVTSNVMRLLNAPSFFLHPSKFKLNLDRFQVCLMVLSESVDEGGEKAILSDGEEVDEVAGDSASLGNSHRDEYFR
jgi:hypothetical protein